MEGHGMGKCSKSGMENWKLGRSMHLRKPQVERAAVKHDILYRVAEFYFDVPAHGRAHERTRSQVHRQRALGIIPFELNAHPSALPVIERDAVVFIKEKRAISAGINVNGEWAFDFFIDVLFDGAERKNCAFADEERKSFQIDGAFDGLRIIGIVKPKAAHQGHSGESGFADGAVQIRQQTIAQLQILAANRLDLRIVQFAEIGERGTTIATDLCGADFAGVPTPGQAELPRAAVATKERAKRAELEPAQVKFCGEFFRWNKSADVRAPIRNAAESCIDCDGNMSLQSFPGRVHVAGPKKRSIALHSREAVAMQCVRAFVGAIELRPLPVHAIAGEARFDTEGIALVGPPAVHA